MCRSLSEGGRRCRWHSAPTAVAITNALRRVAYHEDRCSALAGMPGEDAALGNYVQALEDMQVAEQVHADRVIDVNDSAAYDYRRDAVQHQSVQWLMQQHQALAHDPDAQETIAERLLEREGDGEELTLQGRYAIRQAKDRIVASMTADGLYTEVEARRSVDGWFGAKPDEAVSVAQRNNVSEVEARREYNDMLAFEYMRATEETRGSLLSRRGLAAGVSSESLFRGPLSQAEPYASEELRSYWARHGRLTWAAYRFQALGRESDRGAATRARTQLPDDVAMVS